jgi:AraC-like DNA-binding protein
VSESGASRVAGAARFWTISTEQVAPKERLEFFRNVVLNRSDADFSRTDRQRPFQASILATLGAKAQVRDGRSDPVVRRRPPSACRRDGADEILVSAWLEVDQPSHYQLGDQQLGFGAGDITVMDYGRPMTIDVGRYREVNLRLSRASVAAAVGADPTSLAGQVLPKTPLTALLFSQMRRFVEAMPAMSDDERRAGLQLTAEFALQTLDVVAKRRLIESDSRDDWLWEAAGYLIERRLGDRALSPEQLARCLRCSRATIYRLFERRGMSVMEHVAERRLARAHGMLRDGHNRLPIADIAMACGFDDPSSFSRRFRQRFGSQPRQVREEHVLPG